MSNEVKKKQEHGAYGTIKISKYVINFLCMYKPYNSNFELSSKWILTKNLNLKKKKKFVCVCVGGGGGGGVEGSAEMKIVCQSNHLHNVEHVV